MTFHDIPSNLIDIRNYSEFDLRYVFGCPAAQMTVSAESHWCIWDLTAARTTRIWPNVVSSGERRPPGCIAAHTTRVWPYALTLLILSFIEGSYSGNFTKTTESDCKRLRLRTTQFHSRSYDQNLIFQCEITFLWNFLIRKFPCVKGKRIPFTVTAPNIPDKKYSTDAILQLKRHFLTAYILVNKFFQKLMFDLWNKKDFSLNFHSSEFCQSFFSSHLRETNWWCSWHLSVDLLSKRA